MAYKYLGYGTTNSDGVAHLDHDADGKRIDNSYTGVGAGEIDVVASLDNPVSSGSIVSVPCSVLDTLFYDDGVTGNVPSAWNPNSSCTMTRHSSDGYTSVTSPSGSGGRTTLNIIIPVNNTIFVDVYQVDGGTQNFIGYAYSSNSDYLNGFGLGHIVGSVGTWYSLKIEFTTTNLKVTNLTNDRTVTRDFNSSYSPTDSILFALGSVGDTTELRYKNLKVYPI